MESKSANDKKKKMILPVKIQGSRQDPNAASKGLFIFQTEIRTQKKEHRPGRNNKKTRRTRTNRRPGTCRPSSKHEQTSRTHKDRVRD